MASSRCKVALEHSSLARRSSNEIAVRRPLRMAWSLKTRSNLSMRYGFSSIGTHGTLLAETCVGMLMIAVLTALFNVAMLATAPNVPLPPTELAIVGAKIYTAPSATPIEDGVVVVRNGRIASVGSRQNTAVPPAARRIDARGCVLTAGFWNSHIHLMTPALLSAATDKAETIQGGLETMLTRWGFTTVFD